MNMASIHASRHHATIHYITMFRTDRYCKWTTVINGVTIPKGAIIDVPISVLHHSPLYWKDPEKFDPDWFVYIFNSIWPSQLKLDRISSTQTSYLSYCTLHILWMLIYPTQQS